MTSFSDFPFVSVLSILNRLNHLLGAAIDAFDQKTSSKVRDSCNQIIALMELLATSEFQYQPQVLTARVMVEQILCRVSVCEPHHELEHISTKAVAATDTLAHSRGIAHFDIEQYIETDTLVCFEDIIGCQRAKVLLEENIILQMKLPPEVRLSIFQGIRSGVGNVMLHGPPGTGKTLLAQAVAHEADATFITVRPSDILSKYHGDSEKFVSHLFQSAKKFEKAVIFFDELDSIATSRRSTDDSTQSRRLLSELLLQMTLLRQRDQSKRKMRRASDHDRGGNQSTDAEQNNNVGLDEHRLVIIAATNRIEDIDEAVIRRFEVKIFVGPPNRAARKLLVLKFLSGIEHVLTDNDLEKICEITFGWSGSDMETVVREAAMIPFREFRDNKSREKEIILDDHNNAALRPVEYKDLETAAATIVRAHMDSIEECDGTDL